ncbi:pyridoxamine 5'-phosphate oxidase family protein [Mycobacterium sp. 050128]|uniref:pyridoxamine 5'-phosphate oxidase family protein n=1 Tax=Mycobacterium sp. 050128 TaxID=3096112 RepID=UPI002EDA5371
MSVKVDLDQLTGALADFTFAYLITFGDGRHAHAVAVHPVLIDGVLEVGSIGNSTRNNIARHDAVTLVWPPREPDGYSLIVDGTGLAGDDALQVVPSRAVLHRKAAPQTVTRPGCKDDCLRLEQP